MCFMRKCREGKGLGETKSNPVGLKMPSPEACIVFSCLDGRPHHLFNYLLQLPHEVSALYGLPSETQRRSTDVEGCCKLQVVVLISGAGHEINAKLRPWTGSSERSRKTDTARGM
jgi:hypothetical protein